MRRTCKNGKIHRNNAYYHTHLIIEPNWVEITKKVKNLEHIIQRCDPVATAPPFITGGGVVPSLYSHIAQSQDQDSDSIPKLFKSIKGKGGKKSGRGKANLNNSLNPLPLLLLPLKKRTPMKR